MIHVFLDSNASYTDPFMQKTIHNRLLLELAQNEHISLYLSQVVRDEMLNNYERQLTKHFETIEDKEGKIKKLIADDDSIPFQWNQTIEAYVEKLDEYLNELEDDGVIQVLPYSNDFLPDLVERSLKRIKPFSEKKLEFRDGIIWFTYVEYVEDNNIDHCYFITKNKADFMQNGELHPQLKEDSDAFTLFETPKDFSESDAIQGLQRTLDWVEEQDFPNNPDTIKSLLEGQCFDTVYEACSSYVLDNSHRIPLQIDTFDSEWLELYGISFKYASDIEVKVLLDTIIVSGLVEIEASFEINDRNPTYEKGDEEYFHFGSGETDLLIQFSLTIDQDLDIEDFDIDDINVW
ncbi:PIN domain-containing protein [Peribacillus frigoritolerans]|uniref:PIN domain-containing protein n=1 Tax=Peribacillus frigoritolerans TaxID=450367 RepID=UPI00207A0439|nr:PIN domain-containing protein [Peribacillus frigoritolerans]USK78971.1 PIN domain-containing protein [Peribacillus frigoritolerans]